MDQHDPLEVERRAQALFDSLARETDELLDIPSPAEIRRRGERRRIRRRTGIAAATMGLCLVAVGSLGSLQGSGPERRIDAAASPSQEPSAPTSAGTTQAPEPSRTTVASTGGPSTALATPSDPVLPTPVGAGPTQPSPTRTSPAQTSPTQYSPATSGVATPSASISGQPTMQDAPTAAQMARASTRMTQDIESTELPQEPFSACQGDITALQYRTLLVRHFTSGGTGAYAVVLGFDDEGDAVAARRTIRGWYSGCADRLEGQGQVAARRPAVAIPLQGAAGVLADPGDGASFREVSWRDPGAERGFFEESTVIQLGNRVAWVVYLTAGAQDNSWDTTATGPAGALYPGIAHAQSWAETLLP